MVNFKNGILLENEDVILTLLIYTDGASRGNPGIAAAAFILVKDGKKIFEQCKYLGKQTNNQAEYQAIILALTKALEFSEKDLILYSDSELVIKQLNGDYRVRQPHLKLLKRKIMNLKEEFTSVTFSHISRDNIWIKNADILCNRCIDENE